MSISDRYHSDFEAGQLALFGAAAAIILFFVLVLTFVS
jgi:hypothetical protein